MPVREGGRLVELTPEVVSAFDKYLEEGKRPEPDFTKLINAVLEEILLKEDFLRNYLPNLDVIATKGSSIYIQDTNSRKVFEVSLENNKVKCYDHNSDQCEHARFAMAMSEFGKVVRFRRNLQTAIRVHNNKEAEEKKNRQSQSKGNSDSESISLMRLMNQRSRPSYLVSASSGSSQLSRNPILDYVEFLAHGSSFSDEALR
jgi:hypothetical protein